MAARTLLRKSVDAMIANGAREVGCNKHLRPSKNAISYDPFLFLSSSPIDLNLNLILYRLGGIRDRIRQRRRLSFLRLDGVYAREAAVQILHERKRCVPVRISSFS